MTARVIPINGKLRSVESFVKTLQENVGEIDQIACVIKWKDTEEDSNGVTSVYFSEMNNGEAAWLDYVFRDDFMAMITENQI